MAFESTGSSDRVELLALVEASDSALVSIDASRELCVARVAARAAGGHFAGTDAGAFHDYWHAEIKPKYSFELTLDNHGEGREQLLLRLARGLCLSFRG